VIAETNELRLGVNSQEIEANDNIVYNNVGTTEMPEENPNKKYVELETDERIGKTLDTILGQLDKICVNMRVRNNIFNNGLFFRD